MRKLVSATAILFLLLFFGLVGSLGAQTKPLSPAMMDPRFFGVVCEGKWNVGMSSALFQFFPQGDRVFVFYQWGAAYKSPGGTGLYSAVAIDENNGGGWGLFGKSSDGRSRIWRFSMVSDGMEVKFSGPAGYMDGALLQCHALGVIYGRLPMSLPPDLKIVAPTADTPRDVTALSGIWFGIWTGDFLNPALVFVEQINGPPVKIAYSLYQPPRWWRHVATYQDGVLKWVSTDTGNKVTFRLLPDGALSGEYFNERLGRLTATIIMTKQ